MAADEPMLFNTNDNSIDPIESIEINGSYVIIIPYADSGDKHVKVGFVGPTARPLAELWEDYYQNHGSSAQLIENPTDFVERFKDWIG